MLQGIHQNMISPWIHTLGERVSRSSLPSFTPSEALHQLLLKREFLKVKELLLKQEPLETAALKSALQEGLSHFCPENDITYFRAICLHPQFSQIILEEPLQTSLIETLLLASIRFEDIALFDALLQYPRTLLESPRIYASFPPTFLDSLLERDEEISEGTLYEALLSEITRQKKDLLLIRMTKIEHKTLPEKIAQYWISFWGDRKRVDLIQKHIPFEPLSFYGKALYLKALLLKNQPLYPHLEKVEENQRLPLVLHAASLVSSEVDLEENLEPLFSEEPSKYALFKGALARGDSQKIGQIRDYFFLLRKQETTFAEKRRFLKLKFKLSR